MVPLRFFLFFTIVPMIPDSWSCYLEFIIAPQKYLTETAIPIEKKKVMTLNWLLTLHHLPSFYLKTPSPFSLFLEIDHNQGEEGK